MKSTYLWWRAIQQLKHGQRLIITLEMPLSNAAVPEPTSCAWCQFFDCDDKICTCNCHNLKKQNLV